MNLTVTGHHFAVTPAIRSYVESKLSRITRHFDHVIDVSVILTVEKLLQKAEITAHLRGKDIFVETADGDLYAAIDGVSDKLDRSILKYKESLKNHHREALKHQPQAEES